MCRGLKFSPCRESSKWVLRLKVGLKSIFQLTARDSLLERKNEPGNPLHTHWPVTVASFRTWRGWRDCVAWEPGLLIITSKSSCLLRHRFSPQASFTNSLFGLTIGSSAFCAKTLSLYRLGREILSLVAFRLVVCRSSEARSSEWMKLEALHQPACLAMRKTVE